MQQYTNSEKKLVVSGDGVFFSIQGEGASMGIPTCFLRLHFCNLKCAWCDTWYTWNSSKPEFFSEQQHWTIKETKMKIEDAWKCTNARRQKRLVITGGEPLIQQSIIVKLLKLMPDWYIEIETNGTLMPEETLLKRAQFNCSPKLKNSGNSESLRINKEVLSELNRRNSVFKFVVSSPSDIEEVEKFYVQPFNLDIEKIIIMPQGVASAEIQDTALKIVESVKEKGYRLLTRLHIDLWGNKRRI